MNNSEMFYKIFGIYAEEFWSYTEDEMCNWLSLDVPERNVGDLISRQAAIDALRVCYDTETKDYDDGSEWINYEDAVAEIENLSSAKPEQSTGVKDILRYLDEYLHPIVSPEHWSVYSVLYDMVSTLPSANPEIDKDINVPCKSKVCAMNQDDAEKMINEQAIDILKALRDRYIDRNGCPACEEFFAIDKGIEALQNSIEAPKRKTGKWLMYKGFYCKCSECEAIDLLATRLERSGFVLQDRFCPNCGAEMEVEADE